MLVLRRQKKIYRQETKKNTLAKNINNLENDLILWGFFFAHFDVYAYGGVLFQNSLFSKLLLTT